MRSFFTQKCRKTLILEVNSDILKLSTTDWWKREVFMKIFAKTISLILTVLAVCFAATSCDVDGIKLVSTISPVSVSLIASIPSTTPTQCGYKLILKDASLRSIGPPIMPSGEYLQDQ